MIEHVVAQLASAVEEVVVVTSETVDLPPLPARIVRDRDSERGPLAGIRDGLAAVDSEYAFVTSTDAPFLTGSFVSRILDVGKPCAPKSEGHIQVLCAVYPSAGWKEAERLLEAGVGRPLRLLESLGFETLDFDRDFAPDFDGALDLGLAPDRGADFKLDLARETESKPGQGPELDSAPRPWHGFNTPQAYLDCVRVRDPMATAEVELLGRASLAIKDTKQTVPVGTLGEVLECWPETLGLIVEGRVARSHLVSLGGRDLVRDLAVPVGPGECVSILDALAGG
jgi:molybdopterin-guanine dinucleotide biosynthesis protein A